jgi:glycosyltransferase involved in cell wall biosynthesis
MAVDAPAPNELALRDSFRPCVVIPTYDNPRTLRAVVESVRRYLPDVVVVDDGSASAGREAVESLGRDGLAHVHHHTVNAGKGAAMKTGFRLAFDLGFTHALQVDADGQHALEDSPKLLEAARADPEALVLGAPIYDESAPRSRLVGRRITQFWTNRETGGPVIDDPMCGFRVYPLALTVAVPVGADRMDFDIEIAVRLVWAGARVINVPTKVKYLPAEAGGVSHFRMFHDNVRISWLHTRLYNLSVWRRFWSAVASLLRRLRGA